MSNQINTQQVLRSMANGAKQIDEACETNLTRSQGRQVDSGLKALDEGFAALAPVLAQAQKDAASVASLTAKLEEANKGRAEQAIKLVEAEKLLTEAMAEVKALTAKLAQCNEQALKAADTPELVNKA